MSTKKGGTNVRFASSRSSIKFNHNLIMISSWWWWGPAEVNDIDVFMPGNQRQLCGQTYRQNPYSMDRHTLCDNKTARTRDLCKSALFFRDRNGARLAIQLPITKIRILNQMVIFCCINTSSQRQNSKPDFLPRCEVNLYNEVIVQSG